MTHKFAGHQERIFVRFADTDPSLFRFRRVRYILIWRVRQLRR
jgi:hypothetical protein